MKCYNCGAKLGRENICPECGVNVKIYKKIVMASNEYYNDALAKRNTNKQTSSSVSDSTTGKTDSADTGSTAVNALNIASVTPVTADLNTLLNTGIGSNVNVIL